ncbi:hypothetical protein LUZ60_003693 [Juncus effusus]|nr:hypothetical protein LUZ60_003693 [Juncus effusus]
MAHGEMTITLKDVSCLLGMRVDGDPMSKDVNWSQKITDLLGKTPGVNDYRHDSAVMIKTKWFAQNFADLEEGSPELMREYYCRAYILALCNDVLFTEASGDSVSVVPTVFLEDMEKLEDWSWGSEVLAYLYREFCKSTEIRKKNIGGCVTLLQLSAWTHFKFGRPDPPRGMGPGVLEIYDDPDDNDIVRFIWIGATIRDKPGPTHLWGNRDQLDNFHESQIEWTPHDHIKVCSPHTEIRDDLRS